MSERAIKFNMIAKSEITGEVIKCKSLSLEQLLDNTRWGFLGLGFRVIAKRQFTGLYDRDQVEIYEDDLLFHPEFPHPIRVEWNDKEACFESGGCVSEWGDCRVVGNVYQNPELMEQ